MLHLIFSTLFFNFSQVSQTPTFRGALPDNYRVGLACSSLSLVPINEKEMQIVKEGQMVSSPLFCDPITTDHSESLTLQCYDTFQHLSLKLAPKELTGEDEAGGKYKFFMTSVYLQLAPSDVAKTTVENCFAKLMNPSGKILVDRPRIQISCSGFAQGQGGKCPVHFSSTLRFTRDVVPPLEKGRKYESFVAISDPRNSGSLSIMEPDGGAPLYENSFLPEIDKTYLERVPAQPMTRPDLESSWWRFEDARELFGGTCFNDEECFMAVSPSGHSNSCTIQNYEGQEPYYYVRDMICKKSYAED